MARVPIERPSPTEYVASFARYVDLVPPGDVLETLARQIDETARLLGGLGERDAGYRYGEGKWSIREVVGHVADTERIMAYRALCFARGEQAGLPGFDENEYVKHARFDARTLPDLLAELRTVRAATLALFSALDGEELQRRGTANNREYTVRAFPFIIAGHELHHVKILRERYLPGLQRR